MAEGVTISPETFKKLHASRDSLKTCEPLILPNDYIALRDQDGSVTIKKTQL